MEILVVTPPTIEPITYSEAKEQARIDIDAEQSLIESYISAARFYCEKIQNKTYLTTTKKVIYDGYNFPLKLPHPPIQSIDKVEFQQKDGTIVEWDASNYIADTSGKFGWIRLAENYSVPDDLSDINTLQVTFIAGKSTADEVPANVEQSVKMLVAMWYEKRIPIDNAMNYKIPFAVESLLNLDRVVPV